MIGIPLGLAYSNMMEWVLHKYMLHGRGRDKRSFWSFHWHEHHREARKHHMFDPQYVRSIFTWSPQGKEVAALIAGGVVTGLVFPVAPFFTLTAWACQVRYYQKHKRAHLDLKWVKENMPWHYDHHMGRDQNSNWCVTHPWFDHVMGTRKKYVYDEAGRVLAEEAVPPPKGFFERFIKPIWSESHVPVRVRHEEAVEAPAAA
jgi:hypothetical protein